MQTYAPDRVVSLNERSAVRRAPTGPSVYVATAVAELPRVEGAWRALQGGSHAGVFAGYEWSSTVARHYARDRRLHIALASHSGTPVGLAPLAYRQYLGIRTLALLGSGMADYSIADYQDIFLRPGFEQQALTSLVDDAAQAPWDLLWLQEIPAESPVLEYLPDIARDRGWRVVVNADNDVHPRGTTLPVASRPIAARRFARSSAASRRITAQRSALSSMPRTSTGPWKRYSTCIRSAGTL